MQGAIGAALFAGSVILLLPPTHTKANWTSAAYTPPAGVRDRPALEMSAAAPVAPVRSLMDAPPAEPATYARPDRWDDAVTDEATEREIAIAEADRAYGEGYAWASDRDVEDARECRRLEGPAAGGCRDYVASLTPGEDDDREF